MINTCLEPEFPHYNAIPAVIFVQKWQKMAKNNFLSLEISKLQKIMQNMD
jgi:hypothetical protein